VSKASVALIACKGGVGRSTIAGNLAVSLEELGRSVVALGTDPQGSLAAWAEMQDPEAETVLGRLVRLSQGEPALMASHLVANHDLLRGVRW